MKKMWLFILLMFCSVELVGCAVDPGSYYFNADDLMEKVIKIELVECINENPKLIIVKENSLPSFDFNKVKLVKELEEEKIQDFLNELSTVIFHIENESVNSPVGYAVLIYLQNNEIIVLSCTIINKIGYSMVASFTYEGNFIKHIVVFANEPKFKKILLKYFEIK